jgi:EAL and modified HD-GYP domain-containing signal transduction protein
VERYEKAVLYVPAHLPGTARLPVEPEHLFDQWLNRGVLRSLCRQNIDGVTTENDNETHSSKPWRVRVCAAAGMIMTPPLYIARQPILDNAGGNAGFELLYRNPGAGFPGGTDATYAVADRAMYIWGLDTLTGDRTAFININLETLASGALDALPPQRVVFELPSEAFDGESIATVRAAANRGYRFAVDNLTTFDPVRLGAYKGAISHLKIPVADMPVDDIAHLHQQLQVILPGVITVAYKVETRDMFKAMENIGFTLFQGYFFAEPELLEAENRPTGVSITYLLFAEVTRPDVDIKRIEHLITSDPGMAYAVLRLVNSSAIGLATTIESISQAIILLGFARIRQLAFLLSMARDNRSGTDELVVLAALRSRFAGCLAPKGLTAAAETAGLLSVIDAVFGASMEELLADIPISQQIRDALTGHGGPVGDILDVVYAFERADVAAIERLRPGEADELRELYAASVAWAETVRAELFAFNLPKPVRDDEKRAGRNSRPTRDLRRR